MQPDGLNRAKGTAAFGSRVQQTSGHRRGTPLEGFGFARHPVECVRLTQEIHMRTNIVIDDKLMADALKATGAKTKREAVELGLRTLLQMSRQAEVRRLRGKVQWQGDLDAMRRDK
jgi:Arc/MetJ family transcription regulator